MRESPRVRRLRTDFKVLEAMRSESTILDFETSGNPPDTYVVKFRGKGFYRPAGSNEVMITENHSVRIRLGASYPRVMPEMTWESPFFHPNVSGSGVVCLGGYGTYWVPSLNLDELCEMLWEMIRYQNYDPGSPYNRDAARWVETQDQYHLPIDPRPIRDKLAAPAAVVDEPPIEAEVMFIGDVIDAEVVEPDDPDLLIIE